MKKIIQKVIVTFDVLMVPVVVILALCFKFIRLAGIRHLPATRKVLSAVGVFPILDHFYEPKFKNARPRSSYSDDRSLPGIDWNSSGQLQLLEAFVYSAEISELPDKVATRNGFLLSTEEFGSGDAEFWYQLVRVLKPRNIIEIGSGFSTWLALRAIERNKLDNPFYDCHFRCIDPFAKSWLDSESVAVEHSKVEEVAVEAFSTLGENDILFIDSSHMIRPQGDVLFEYLQLLPTLKQGVYVHIHDIFSPRDYPEPWIVDQVRFWNEQYLVEAFLTHNDKWQVVGGLSYLHHHHYDHLKAVCPFLQKERLPGSLYIKRVG